MVEEVERNRMNKSREGSKSCLSCGKLWMNMFEAMAIFICTHPWKVCIISFLLNALLGVGMINFSSNKLLNNDIQDLYILKNSQTQKTASRLLRYFPDQSGHDFYAHQSIKQPIFAEILLWRKDRGNILNDSSYHEIAELVNYIKNISTFSVSGGHAKYSDVCARRNGECVIQGEDLIEHIRDNYDGEISINDTSTVVGSWLDRTITNIGNYVIANDTIKSAVYLKVRFYLRQDNENMLRDSYLWQSHFVTFIKRFKTKKVLKELDFVYQHSGSFLEELGNDTFKDIPYFSLIFTIFYIYIGIILSGGNNVSKRVNIGRIGIAVTPISVLGAWGLLMGCGVEFTNTIGIFPLFIQGHQVINVLITFSHLSDVNDVRDAKKRVAHAIQKSSVPITITTVVHVITFITGVFSDYYVLKLVCIYCATTLFFNYFNHFVFFTVALALNEHRVDAGLHFCFCNKLSKREELKEEGRNCCIVCCCSGNLPETREDTESKFERAPRKLMSRFLLTCQFRFFITLGFMTYLTFSVLGISQYNINSLEINTVSFDSYFYKWTHHNSGYFVNEPVIQLITMYPPNNTIILGNYCMKKWLNRSEYLRTDTLRVSSKAYKENKSSDDFSEQDLSRTSKYVFLKETLSNRHDIVFDKPRSQIIASRDYIKTTDILSTQAMLKLKMNLEDLTENISDCIEDSCEKTTRKSSRSKIRQKCSADMIAHSPAFLLTDGYMQPLWYILMLATVQFSLLFVVLLLFHQSFLCSLQVVMCYASMVGGMFGISTFFGVYLTQVSMISYIAGTCFIVDVIGHTLYCFIQTEGTDRLARLNNVLSSVAQSLFHVSFGQFLGLLALIAVRSYVFNTVFVILLLVTLICVSHAIFFMPTLLSFLAKGDEKVPQTSLGISMVKIKTVSCAENGIQQIITNEYLHSTML